MSLSLRQKCRLSFCLKRVSVSPQPVGFVSFDSRSEAEAAKNALNVSRALTSLCAHALNRRRHSHTTYHKQKERRFCWSKQRNMLQGQHQLI